MATDGNLPDSPETSDQDLIVRSFPAGSTIFREGEAGDCAYVVEEGEVEISTFVKGQHLIIGTLEPGDLFGEMALLDNHVRTATAFAKGFVRVIQINRGHISDTVRSSDPMAAFLLKTVLNRYREMRDRLHASADAERLKEIGRQTKPPEQRAPDEDALRASTILRGDVRLRAAFMAKELEMFAQPIHNVASGGSMGAELLLRWRNPSRGLLGPDSIVPPAERSGLIVDIGYWIVDEACRAIALLDDAYRATGRPDPIRYLSVNVSPRQFFDDRFVDRVAEIIETHRVSPQRIKFEITESMILQEAKRTESHLPRLKELGFGLALDDFGTGYSSLTHMLRFPIDTLKIDRSFISRMEGDAKARSIVSALIALSHSLGMTVIAEGAERETDVAILRDMGCDSVQGYFYSAPKPLRELRAYLIAHGELDG